MLRGAPFQKSACNERRCDGEHECDRAHGIRVQSTSEEGDVDAAALAAAAVAVVENRNEPEGSEHDPDYE